jgi:hypothetical protein
MTNRNDEIRVQRRDGMPWWIWLVAIALIALIAWWLLTMNNNTGTTTPSAPPSTVPSLTAPSSAPAESTSPDASPSA